MTVMYRFSCLCSVHFSAVIHTFTCRGSVKKNGRVTTGQIKCCSHWVTLVYKYLMQLLLWFCWNTDHKIPASLISPYEELLWRLQVSPGSHEPFLQGSTPRILLSQTPEVIHIQSKSWNHVNRWLISTNFNWFSNCQEKKMPKIQEELTLFFVLWL